MEPSAPLDSLAQACPGGYLAGRDALYWVADEFDDHEGSCDAAFD